MSFHDNIIDIELIVAGEPVIDTVANRPHIRLWENTMANHDAITSQFTENLVNNRCFATDPPSDQIMCEGGYYYSSNGKRRLEIAENELSPHFLPVSAAGQYRFDLLCADDSENLVIVTGVETTTDDYKAYHPDVPSNMMCLAIVRIHDETTVEITDTDIIDSREWLNKGGGVSSSDSGYTVINEFKDHNPSGNTSTLGFSPDFNNHTVVVFADGVNREKDVDFTISGNVITWTLGGGSDVPEDYIQVIELFSGASPVAEIREDKKDDWNGTDTVWSGISFNIDQNYPVIIYRDNAVCKVGTIAGGDDAEITGANEITFAEAPGWTRVINFKDVTSNGAGHIIQEDGISLPSRDNLNFIGFNLTDSPGTDSTEVSLPEAMAIEYSKSGGFGEVQANHDIYYYIDQATGDDTTGKGTSAEPFKTISKAFEITPTLWDGDFHFIIIGDSYKISGTEICHARAMADLDSGNVINYVIRPATDHTSGGIFHLYRDTTLADGTATTFYIGSGYRNLSAGSSRVIFRGFRVTDVKLSIQPQCAIYWGDAVSSYVYTKQSGYNPDTIQSLMYFSSLDCYHEDATDKTLSIDLSNIDNTLLTGYKQALIQVQEWRSLLLSNKLTIQVSTTSVEVPAVAVRSVSSILADGFAFLNGATELEISGAYIGLILGCSGWGSNPNTLRVDNKSRSIGIILGNKLALTNCVEGIHLRRNIKANYLYYGTEPVFTGCTSNYVLDSGAELIPCQTL